MTQLEFSAASRRDDMRDVDAMVNAATRIHVTWSSLRSWVYHENNFSIAM